MKRSNKKQRISAKIKLRSGDGFTRRSKRRNASGAKSLVEGAAPVLRWAGSKRQLVPTLRTVAPTSFDRYVEPFAGSASLLFALNPRKAVLADINSDLINFYRVLRRRPSNLHKSVSKLARSKRMYREVRADNRTGRATTANARARRFLYLNRLCFNGVYRVNKEGEFNVPMGSKPAPFPTAKALRDCAEILKRTELKCGDFEKTLKQCGSGDFVYVDPPYYSARHRGEYCATEFGAAELNRLVRAIRAAKRRGAKIALSYTYSMQLRKLLPGWQFRRVRVRRSVAGDVQRRKMGTEALAISYSK